MWPLFPLVVEGLLKHCLAAAFGAGVAWYLGYAPAWAPLAVVVAFGIYTRFKGTERRSQTAGTVTRAEHDAQVEIIEKVAQRWDPSLQRGRNQSVRDFMVRLRERCRGISSTQSNAYTDFYEKARFSEEVITLDEYNRFTDVSLHLVSVLLDSARARDAEGKTQQ